MKWIKWLINDQFTRVNIAKERTMHPRKNKQTLILPEPSNYNRLMFSQQKLEPERRRTNVIRKIWIRRDKINSSANFCCVELEEEQDTKVTRRYKQLKGLLQNHEQAKTTSGSNPKCLESISTFGATTVALLTTSLRRGIRGSPAPQGPREVETLKAEGRSPSYWDMEAVAILLPPMQEEPVNCTVAMADALLVLQLQRQPTRELDIPRRRTQAALASSTTAF